MRIFKPHYWNNKQEIELTLQQALTPPEPYDIRDRADEAMNHARCVGERFGALLAVFVEKGILDFEVARVIAGTSHERIRIED